MNISRDGRAAGEGEGKRDGGGSNGKKEQGDGRKNRD